MTATARPRSGAGPVDGRDQRRRALVERPHRRGLWRRVVASLSLVLVAVTVLVPAASAGATPAEGSHVRPRRVLIVTLPRVTWAAIRDQRPPNLVRFFDRAAVASMSTRTVGPRTGSADAYLTLGAGNRASALNPLTAGDAAQLEETRSNGSAAEVYRRRTGIEPTGDIVVLSIAEQIARNDALLYGAKPGALASSLAAAGHRTAAVGNADTALVDAVPQREVALGAMGRDGQVAVGNVSSSLLVADPLAPFGVRTDVEALISSVEQGWSSAEVQFVEMSDLERADDARVDSTTAQGDAQFESALARSDATFARLVSTMDLRRDLVIAVAPTSPGSTEELTVFGVQGPGFAPGWARSPTTRRAGFVTLTDIAPTILDAYGINPPEEINDTPVVAVGGGGAIDQRIDTMVRDNERALFRDEVTGPITVAFIVGLVVLLLTVMVAVGRSAPWRPPLRWCSLAVVATPAMMYLSGLLPYGPFSVVTFGLAIAAGSALLAAVATLVGRFDPVAPPVIVCACSVALLGIDIVVGGPLQLNTVFGYSPIVAGRFAGYGNQAFSILTICALVAVTGGWEISRRRSPGSSNTGRLIAAIAVFLAVVVLDGSPTWGSDVGGVLASIPAFAVCILVLLGIRIRLRLIALIGAATVGVLVLFAAFDLSRPVDARTHLGRFAQKLIDGGGALILQRKFEANMSILTSTVWTFVIPMALLFIGYLTWRPNRMMQRLNAEHDGFRAFGISGLTLGLLAWALNDSGVSIPALMLTVALPYTAYLVLGLSDSDPSEPADDEVRDGGDPEERSVSDSSVPGERSEVGEANAGSVLGEVAEMTA